MPPKKGGKDGGKKGGKNAEKEALIEADIALRVKAFDKEYAKQCALLQCEPNPALATYVKTQIKEAEGKVTELRITADFQLPTTSSWKALMLALKEDSKLERLLMWGTNCGDGGITALLELLRKNALTTLELLDDKVGPIGCSHLSSVLIKDIKLQVLLLDYNHIGDEGAANLAAGLQWNSELKTLSMQYCRIGCAGARSIADQVLLNSRVTQLDLQGNEIGTAGFIAIMDALRKNVNLERLNVADNAIDETLYSMEKLCSMMHLNRTLKHLNMKFNLIGRAGAELIIEALKEGEGSALLSLSTTGQDITTDMFKELNFEKKGGKRKKGKGKGKGKKKK